MFHRISDGLDIESGLEEKIDNELTALQNTPKNGSGQYIVSSVTNSNVKRRRDQCNDLPIIESQYTTPIQSVAPRACNKRREAFNAMYANQVSDTIKLNPKQIIQEKQITVVVDKNTLNVLINDYLLTHQEIYKTYIQYNTKNIKCGFVSFILHKYKEEIKDRKGIKQKQKYDSSVPFTPSPTKSNTLFNSIATITPSTPITPNPKRQLAFNTPSPFAVPPITPSSVLTNQENCIPYIIRSLQSSTLHSSPSPNKKSRLQAKNNPLPNENPTTLTVKRINELKESDNNKWKCLQRHLWYLKAEENPFEHCNWLNYGTTKSIVEIKVMYNCV